MDLIIKIINANSIEDLKGYLNEFLNFLNSKAKGKRAYIKELNAQLTSIYGAYKIEALFKEGYNKKVHIHDYIEAPSVYATHQLIAINRINDYKIRLKELISFFDEFAAPKTKSLTISEVSKVLELVQSKMQIFDVITCINHIDIFLFNNSLPDLNSLTEVYKADGADIYSKINILLLAPREQKYDPYQVLVHELGHALQMTLTHKHTSVPLSFVEMNKEINVHLNKDHPDTAEVFADVFSAVAMYDSYLAEHNEFINFFGEDLMILFSFYFKRLIEHANTNIDILKNGEGDITWEKLP